MAKTITEGEVAALRARAEKMDDPQLQTMALSLIWSMEYSLQGGWSEGCPKCDSRVTPPENHTFSSAMAWVEKLLSVDTKEGLIG